MHVPPLPKGVDLHAAYVNKPRRAGDIAENYANCDKARELMGWTAQYGIDDMCADSWRWQSMNPNGYVGATE